MIIETLTCHIPDNAPRIVPLDPRLHMIHCADTHTSRSLSRALHQLLYSTPTPDANAADGRAMELAGHGQIAMTVSHGNAPELMTAIEPPAHFDLDDLCDVKTPHDAEALIALHLSALMDTATLEYDLVATSTRLDAFAQSIGRGNAGNGMLAQTVAARDTLKEAQKAALALRDSLQTNASIQRESRNHILSLRAQQRTLEAKRAAVIYYHVERTEALIAELDVQRQETQPTHALDSEQAAAIQRAATQVETAQLQCTQSREQLQQILEELEARHQEVQGTSNRSPSPAAFPEELPRQIRSCLNRCTELNARIEEVDAQISEQDSRICDAEQQFAALPDFSRVAANPVDWFNQLAHAFKTAQYTRDRVLQRLAEVRNELTERRIEIAGDAAIFTNSGQLAEALVEQENTKVERETKHDEISEQRDNDLAAYDDLKESVTGLVVLGLGCLFFLALLLGAYVGLQKTPILIPALLSLLSALYFLSQLLLTRRHLAQLTQDIGKHNAARDLLREEERNTVSQVARLMARAGCDKPRELMARYDRYCELREEIAELEKECALQQENAAESEARIPKLFECIRGTLTKVHVEPDDEQDVEAAVGRAVAKYQVYREVKRRRSELRNQHQGLIGRRRFLEGELARVRGLLLESERRMRAIMHENGFSEEVQHQEISEALATYYQQREKVEQALERSEILVETRHALEIRLADEEALLTRHQRNLDTLLAHARVHSPEEARELAAARLTLQDKDSEIEQLKAQRDALLEGHDRASWKARAGAMLYTGEHAPSESPEQLQARSAELDQMLKKAKDRFYDLRNERSRKLATQRPLFEYEEARAELEACSASLRMNRAAAAKAITLIEERLPHCRSRHTVSMGNCAARFLQQAGVPAQLQLELGEDLALHAHIELSESADTQITAQAVYLACRLAALDTLSREGRPLLIDATLQGGPMPFSPHAFLRLANDCAEKRQLLVISEENQLAAAAAETGTAQTTF